MAVSRRPKGAINRLGILPWDCLKIRFGAFWHFAVTCQGWWFSLLAHRFASKGSFLGGYFFGKRGLGSWLLALDWSYFSGQNGPIGLAAATERLRQI